ncbi:MAG: hypothetical protein AAF802_09845 [Planctomycetota bacterium]
MNRRTYARAASLTICIGLIFPALSGCDSSKETTAPAVTESIASEPAFDLEAFAEFSREKEVITGVSFRDELMTRSQTAGAIERLSGLGSLKRLRLGRSMELADTDFEMIGKLDSLEHLDLRACRVNDDRLLSLQRLGRLRSLRLSGRDTGSELSQSGVDAIGQLSSLKVLAIDFITIGDDGFSKLAQLEKMVELYAAATGITDESASVVGKFRALKKLRLSSNALTSQAIESWSSLDQLSELDISDCQNVDSDSLSKLSTFKSLTKLNLYNTSLDNRSWDSADFNSLAWLNVDKTMVGDEALPFIGKLANLKFLHLGSTKVTDRGMPDLAGLGQLEKLIVTRTAVTAAGVEKLQETLPDTKIQLVYEPGK